MKILIVNKFLYPNGGSETYIFRLGEELVRMGHEVQYFGMEHEGRIVGNRVNSYTEDMEFHARSAGAASFGSKVMCKVAGPAKKLTYPFKIIYSEDSKRKIRAVLEDFRPDAVHLNNINFQITPSIIDEIRAFDPKIRILYTAHDYQWVCPNHMLRRGAEGELCDAKCLADNYKSCEENRCIHNSRLRSILGAIEGRYYAKKQTYAAVNTIICPSRFMEQELTKNPVLAGRTVAMHNFLTVDKTEAAKRAALPAELTDTRGRRLPERYALYFGRFDKEKGIDVLMQAIAALPDIPFVLVGKNSDKAYEEYAEKAVDTEQDGSVKASGSAADGSAKAAGTKSDGSAKAPAGVKAGKAAAPDTIYPVAFLTGDALKAVIQGAEFSLHPAIWYENCPFAVMESELYGTPVIAARIGGIPELVSEGVTGDLFAAGDAAELARAIRKRWSNQETREKSREECIRWSAEHFDSLTEYTKKMLALYRGEKA